MGECILYGNGGGNPLNFNVVGGTSTPSNPKENTVWVNTNTAIHSWDFSASEPYRRSGNKNLNVYPYYHTTRTENGLTFTDNGNGTVTANGTASANTYFRIHYAKTKYVMELEPGTYTLSDAAGTADGFVELLVSYNNEQSYSTVANCSSGKATFTITKKAIARVAIKLFNGKTFSNVMFKPQLEKGSTATSFVKGDATGQVWFPTLNQFSTNFNAVKRNEICVYPISPKQYISGAWAIKTAKMYQGSNWVEYWRGHLINGASLPVTPFGQLTLNFAGHAQATAEMSVEKGGLYIYIPKVSSSYSKAYFTPSVNLRDYSTLTVKWQARGYRNAVGFVDEVETSGGTTQTFVACVELNNKGKELSEITTSTLDISGLSGFYTFCATTAGSSSSNSNMYGELLLIEAVLS